MSIKPREKIFTAIAKQKKIKIKYTDAEGITTKRIVQPYHVFKWKRRIYFIGFCEYDKDIRNFRVGRIKQIDILTEKFNGSIPGFTNLKLKGHFSVFSNYSFIEKLFDESGAQPRSMPWTECPLPPPKKLHRFEKTVKNSGFMRRKHYGSFENDYPISYSAPKLCNAPAKCRSPVEEEVFNYLNHAYSVYRYWIEPINIPFISGGNKYTYTPDVMIEYRDKNRLLIEVKSLREMNDADNLHKYEVGQNYCDDQINLGFEIWTSDNGRIKKFKLSDIQAGQFMSSDIKDNGYNDSSSAWTRIISYFKELMS